MKLKTMVLAACTFTSTAAFCATTCGKPKLTLQAALTFSDGAYSNMLQGMIHIDDMPVPGLLGNKGISPQFAIIAQKAISEGKDLCYEYSDGSGVLSIKP